jgi:hypothetical protein
MPNRSLRALLLFLAAFGVTVAMVRPPLMRRVALRLVEKNLDVRVQTRQAVPHGLLEGMHLHNLEVRCTRAPATHPFLFTAGKLRVESGILGALLHPASPESIACERFKLRLDFDQGGKLLTFLPQVEAKTTHRPKIRLDDWELVLAQAGRAPFHVKGRSCLLEPTPHGHTLETRFTDERYGTWSVRGTMEGSPARLRLTLASEDARLTPTHLLEIPFIPREVWDQVELRGTGQAKLDLDITPGMTHHHLVLDGKELDIQVPIAGIQATGVSGRAEVDGRLVRLTDLQGRVWGGKLALPESLLDFDKPFPELTFRVMGEGLRLADLVGQPWAKGAGGLTRMATLLRGTASGQLAMAFTLTGPLPKVDIQGTGEAGIRGGPQVHWVVKTDRGRVRFEPVFKAK